MRRDKTCTTQTTRRCLSSLKPSLFKVPHGHTGWTGLGYTVIVDLIRIKTASYAEYTVGGLPLPLFALQPPAAIEHAAARRRVAGLLSVSRTHHPPSVPHTAPHPLVLLHYSTGVSTHSVTHVSLPRHFVVSLL